MPIRLNQNSRLDFLSTLVPDITAFHLTVLRRCGRSTSPNDVEGLGCGTCSSLDRLALEDADV